MRFACTEKQSPTDKRFRFKKNSNNNAVTKWSNHCWNDEWNYDELILNAVTIKNKNNNDVAKDSNNDAVTKNNDNNAVTKMRVLTQQRIIAIRLQQRVKIVML